MSRRQQTRYIQSLINFDQSTFYIHILLIFLILTISKSVLTCIVYGTEQLESNLCKSKTCPFYGKCKLDEQSFIAKCVCQDECTEIEEISNIKNAAVAAAASQLFMIAGTMSEHGETISSNDYEANISGRSTLAIPKTRQKIISSLFNHTVCGTDGLDYENFCELKKESCRSSRDIKIFYFGKCSNYLNNYLFLIFRLKR